MRLWGWLAVPLMLVASALVGIAHSGGAQGTFATPGVVGTQGAVVVEYVGDTQPATVPGHTLELTRITLPAGAEIPPEDHPGASVMFVESGAVEITLEQGTLQLFPRMPGDPAPVANPQPCPSPCRVEAGSSAVQNDFTRHNLLDVSGTGSVVLVSQFTANFTDGTATPGPDGTPTAGPAGGPPITTYGCDGGCR